MEQSQQKVKPSKAKLSCFLRCFLHVIIAHARTLGRPTQYTSARGVANICASRARKGTCNRVATKWGQSGELARPQSYICDARRRLGSPSLPKGATRARAPHRRVPGHGLRRSAARLHLLGPRLSWQQPPRSPLAAAARPRHRAGAARRRQSTWPRGRP